MSSGERTLVTGGGGFIGSHLVERLLRDGYEVRVLDNFATGHRENLAEVVDEIELVEGDIQSYERVHNAVRGCELVFHIAALPSVPRSVQDPLTSTASNVTGTLNVLLAARDEGVRRVVFASSSSVYGPQRELPQREEAAARPISPYAVSKLAAEGYCRAFTQVYGLETVALRYFNVFGPRQDPLSQYAAVIPRFITAVLDGRAPGDLRRRRAVEGLHLHRQHGRGEPARGDRRGGRRRDLQRRLRRGDHPERAARQIGEISGKPVEATHAERPARRPAALPGGHLAGPRGPRLRARGRSPRGARANIRPPRRGGGAKST